MYKFWIEWLAGLEKKQFLRKIHRGCVVMRILVIFLKVGEVEILFEKKFHTLYISCMYFYEHSSVSQKMILIFEL